MEEVIAKWKKSTERKIVWSVDVKGVEFKLYIPKWRIPDSTPEKISISIYFPFDGLKGKRFISKAEIQTNPQLKKNKIYADVHKNTDKTETIRFDPNGDPNNWEIGSPYIPKSLLGEYNFDELSLVIEWLG